MIIFILWIILLILCWPIAIIGLILYPIVWLILLPFRLLGFTVTAIFDLLQAIIRFPIKVLDNLSKKNRFNKEYLFVIEF